MHISPLRSCDLRILRDPRGRGFDLGDGWFDRKAGFIGSIGAGKSWENDEKRWEDDEKNWEKQGKIELGK